MKSFKLAVYVLILILSCSIQSFADSNSLNLPELSWSSDYHFESDSLTPGEVSGFIDGLRVDLNGKAANLYFLNRSYYSLDLKNNLQLGSFDFQEYYFSGEQGLIDFLSAVSGENLSEDSYRLKGEIDSINLQGYYIGRNFNISEKLLVDFRLKYINSGHLEKSKYDGRARISEQFIYQSGYRQVIVSRDKNYQPKGISLDIAGNAILANDLSLRFSAENLYSYIIFEDLYFREMFDRTGNFYNDDTAIRITPIYQVDFDYRSILFGFSYINRYEPYFGYSFKFGQGTGIPVEVVLSLHRSKYGIKISPNWNRGDIKFDIKFDNFNFKKAKNISLNFNISF